MYDDAQPISRPPAASPTNRYDHSVYHHPMSTQRVDAQLGDAQASSITNATDVHCISLQSSATLERDVDVREICN